jgi:hypothetical protein
VGRAELNAFHLQRRAIVRLGTAAAAGGLIERGKIVQNNRDFRMARAVLTTVSAERLPVEFLRFREFPLAVKDGRKRRFVRSNGQTASASHIAPKLQRLPGISFAPTETPSRVFHAAEVVIQIGQEEVTFGPRK